ncbi:MAG: sulfatase-like hydrolase/transferase, partial [Candidatus Eremiobacterota bacterium]
MNSARSRWSMAVLFVLFSGALLAVVEWAAYRRLLGMEQRVWQPLLDEVALGSLLFLLAMFLTAPVLLVFGAVSSRGWGKSAWLLLLAGWAAAFGWQGLDFACQGLTGNHISYYMSFLADVMATPKNQGAQFAGGSEWLNGPILRALGSVLGIGLLSLVAARLAAPRVPAVAATGLLTTAVLAALTAQLAWSESELAWRAYRRLPVEFELLRAASFRLRPASVHIVAARPAAGQVTLHNVSGRTLELEGWALASTGAEVKLKGSLPPEATLEVACGLSHRGDMLMLRDARGRLQHRVQYAGGGGGTAIAFPDRGRFEGFRRELATRLEGEFEELSRSLAQDQPVDRTARLTGPKPHLVVLVVESLRRDALDDMPGLARWARQGLWLRRHYAATNSSHLGLYTLLYGRNPIVYRRDLERGVPPLLNDLLGRSGYRRTFMISSQFGRWMGMNLFVNPSTFERMDVPDASAISWRTWIPRDRELLREIPDLLAKSHEPQMVVAFLKSTHFPYGFPPEFELHRPCPEGLVRSGSEPVELRNRYRNSCAFLDSEIDTMLKRLDLSDTVVVVTGDHGEAFFDDGALSHGTRSSEAQCGVPCVVLGAGVPPRSIHTATAHADLLPTLYHILSGRTGLRGTHGRDLLAGQPLEDSVLLCPLRSWAPYELLLVDGPDKVQLSIHQEPGAVRTELGGWSPGAIEVAGFVNDRGELQQGADVSLDQLPQWEQAFRREL